MQVALRAKLAMESELEGFRSHGRRPADWGQLRGNGSFGSHLNTHRGRILSQRDIWIPRYLRTKGHPFSSLPMPVLLKSAQSPHPRKPPRPPRLLPGLETGPTRSQSTRCRPQTKNRPLCARTVPRPVRRPASTPRSCRAHAVLFRLCISGP